MTAATETDRALVDRVAKGDRAAVRLLFMRHHARVYRFVARQTGSETMADDIANEVFLELWKQAKKKLLWSTFFVWVGLIVFLVSMAVLFPANGKFGPDVLMDWPNRIMISVQCIWLVVVARQAIKINTAFNPSSAQTKSYKKVIAY